MLVRIIILTIFFYYYKNIYNFLLNNNLLTYDGIVKKCSKSLNEVDKMINDNKLNINLKKLKDMDPILYKEIKKRLKKINKIYNIISINKSISIKNDYNYIKMERKEILNKISSITLNKGFNDSLNNLLDSVDNYILKILHRIMDIQKNKSYNTEWFEDSTIDKNGYIGVEDDDTFFEKNFSIF